MIHNYILVYPPSPATDCIILKQTPLCFSIPFCFFTNFLASLQPACAIILRTVTVTVRSSWFEGCVNFSSHILFWGSLHHYFFFISLVHLISVMLCVMVKSSMSIILSFCTFLHAQCKHMQKRRPNRSVSILTFQFVLYCGGGRIYLENFLIDYFNDDC